MSSAFVVGLGLIGGSIARGLRAAGWQSIIGIDADSEAVRQALKLGLIDQAADDLGTGLLHADVTVIAVPNQAIVPTLAALAPANEQLRSAGVVVTDTGSVKGSVIRGLEAVFGAVPSWFVPGHPVAGAERSGVLAGRADLFRDHKVVLTPVAATDACAIARVTAMWEDLAATVVTMSALEHDRVLARTSHLPHLLAYVLVDSVARQPDSDAVFELAAAGFRDFTRIASSDPVMWRDIAAENKQELLEATDVLLADLAAARAQLAAGEHDALAALFGRAKRARDTWLQRRADTLTGEQ